MSLSSQVTLASLDTRKMRPESLALLKSNYSLEKTLKKNHKLKPKVVVDNVVANGLRSRLYKSEGASAAALKSSNSQEAQHAINSDLQSTAGQSLGTTGSDSVAINVSKEFSKVAWFVFQKYSVKPVGDLPFDAGDFALPIENVKEALMTIADFHDLEGRSTVINEIKFGNRARNAMLSWSQFKALSVKVYKHCKKRATWMRAHGGTVGGVAAGSNCSSYRAGDKSRRSGLVAPPMSPINLESSAGSVSAFASLEQMQRKASTVVYDHAAENGVDNIPPASQREVKLKGKLVPVDCLKDAMVGVFRREEVKSRQSASRGGTNPGRESAGSRLLADSSASHQSSEDQQYIPIYSTNTYDDSITSDQMADKLNELESSSVLTVDVPRVQRQHRSFRGTCGDDDSTGTASVENRKDLLRPDLVLGRDNALQEPRDMMGMEASTRSPGNKNAGIASNTFSRSGTDGSPTGDHQQQQQQQQQGRPSSPGADTYTGTLPAPDIADYEHTTSLQYTGNDYMQDGKGGDGGGGLGESSFTRNYSHYGTMMDNMREIEDASLRRVLYTATQKTGVVAMKDESMEYYAKWHAMKHRRNERYQREFKQRARKQLLRNFSGVLNANESRKLDKAQYDQFKNQEEADLRRKVSQRKYELEKSVALRLQNEYERKRRDVALIKEKLEESHQFTRAMSEQELSMLREKTREEMFALDDASSSVVSIPQELQIRLKAARTLTNYEIAKKDIQLYFESVTSERLQRYIFTKQNKFTIASAATMMDRSPLDHTTAPLLSDSESAAGSGKLNANNTAANTSSTRRKANVSVHPMRGTTYFCDSTVTSAQPSSTHTHGHHHHHHHMQHQHQKEDGPLTSSTIASGNLTLSGAESPPQRSVFINSPAGLNESNTNGNGYGTAKGAFAHSKSAPQLSRQFSSGHSLALSVESSEASRSVYNGAKEGRVGLGGQPHQGGVGLWAGTGEGAGARVGHEYSYGNMHNEDDDEDSEISSIALSEYLLHSGLQRMILEEEAQAQEQQERRERQNKRLGQGPAGAYSPVARESGTGGTGGAGGGTLLPPIGRGQQGTHSGAAASSGSAGGGRGRYVSNAAPMPGMLTTSSAYEGGKMIVSRIGTGGPHSPAAAAASARRGAGAGASAAAVRSRGAPIAGSAGEGGGEPMAVGLNGMPPLTPQGPLGLGLGPLSPPRTPIVGSAATILTAAAPPHHTAGYEYAGVSGSGGEDSRGRGRADIGSEGEVPVRGEGRGEESQEMSHEPFHITPMYDHEDNGNDSRERRGQGVRGNLSVGIQENVGSRPAYVRSPHPSPLGKKSLPPKSFSSTDLYMLEQTEQRQVDKRHAELTSDSNWKKAGGTAGGGWGASVEGSGGLPFSLSEDSYDSRGGYVPHPRDFPQFSSPHRLTHRQEQRMQHQDAGKLPDIESHC